jgi:serine/threonine-protein kinase
MNLTVGSTLQGGTYQLRSLLSRGELSIAFIATHTRSNTLVVIKTVLVNPHIPIDASQVQHRFREAAQQWAQCSHPGLVRVLDQFEEFGVPFVVMDYVAGDSLSDLVKREGVMPASVALRYIRQASSALAVLHQHGLLHQDIKPQTLIRPSAADCVVVVDFGSVHAWVSSPGGSSITLAVDPYTAPEQMRSSDRATAATDIYALAATLCYLLTGQEPSHSGFTVPDGVQLNPTIVGALVSGMQREPELRPPSISAWLAEFPLELLSDGAALNSQTMQQNGRVPATVELPVVPPLSSALPVQDSLAPPPARIGRRVSTLRSALRLRKTPALVVSAVSVLVGVATGLALRMHGATGPGSTIFHTEQAFPPKLEPLPSVSPEAAIERSPFPETPRKQRTPPIEVAPPDDFVPPEPTVDSYEYRQREDYNQPEDYNQRDYFNSRDANRTEETRPVVPPPAEPSPVPMAPVAPPPPAAVGVPAPIEPAAPPSLPSSPESIAPAEPAPLPAAPEPAPPPAENSPSTIP